MTGVHKGTQYYQQVKLLISMLPIIATETVFALKGGTAINLFVRNFPRLSVDIDLAYLPLDPRNEALMNVRAALQRIVQTINKVPNTKAVLQDNKPDELRIVVSNIQATIKIEVSPVARGTLFEPKVLPVVELVEEEFGYAEIQVVSLPDLYGGKLCAAMDRQHPRDIYDVKLLLDNKGITRDIFVGFLTYVLSHPRPIHEVMQPIWKDLSQPYYSEFEGMTNETVALEQLNQARLLMLKALQSNFTNRDKDFLLSFKRGIPNWSLFDEPTIANLPAVRWKLMNIEKLKTNNIKHTEQLKKLSILLDKWIHT